MPDQRSQSVIRIESINVRGHEYCTWIRRIEAAMLHMESAIESDTRPESIVFVKKSGSPGFLQKRCLLFRSFER